MQISVHGSFLKVNTNPSGTLDLTKKLCERCTLRKSHADKKPNPDRFRMCEQSESGFYLFSHATSYKDGGKTGKGDCKPPFCSLHFRSTYKRFTWKEHLSRYHFCNIFSDSSVPLISRHSLNCIPWTRVSYRRTLHGHGLGQPPYWNQIVWTSLMRYAWQRLFHPELGSQVYHSFLRL